MRKKALGGPERPDLHNIS